jgi:hypothetical protein
MPNNIIVGGVHLRAIQSRLLACVGIQTENNSDEGFRYVRG